MTAKTAKVRWSEAEPPVEVVDGKHLADCLRSVAAKCREGLPIIVQVYVHGFEVGLGLGLPESFVHVERESGEPPYVITVGASEAEGVVAFYLHGQHHTEIPRRNLISTPEALRIVQEFFERGSRSTSVEWEEV
jgi:hypothetical protein